MGDKQSSWETKGLERIDDDSRKIVHESLFFN